MLMFTLRIVFWLWISKNRYNHVGRVCSGDYDDLDALKTVENHWIKDYDYSYNIVAGWCLWLYAFLFMWNLIIRSMMAICLGTDFDPEEEDSDDGYQRYGQRNNRNSRNSYG